MSAAWLAQTVIKIFVKYDILKSVKEQHYGVFIIIWFLKKCKYICCRFFFVYKCVISQSSVCMKQEIEIKHLEAQNIVKEIKQYQEKWLQHRGWTQTGYLNKRYNINQKDEGTWDDRGRDGGTNFIWGPRNRKHAQSFVNMMMMMMMMILTNV